MLIYYIISLIIVGIDQFTKYLTVQNIPLHETLEVIPSFLSFTYHQNTGAAWSMLEGQMIFFYIVTLIVIGVIVYYMQTYGRQDKVFAFSLSLILGGAVGNFIDRLFLQYVVDMIRVEFIDFPIFNVADMSLTIGVTLMVIYLFFDEWKEYRQKKVGKN
ncbi:signal peptidase II [Alkalibacterium putridalgicola]|uniref:Lipoprotein signal peptidase n=1 Tax=Alkalibacterium putridalgicola TaxID=426703 RepID=A0A1H7S6K3_9LACT|nr:signal peptidase II [Alkalibacterium putridalgicola]GEK89081.1 lipoprotein signal peptidase [Alkalibacterium putridalgicola]SEL68271.1 signal peptidase II [Alkalibacterium putridalgicola]